MEGFSSVTRIMANVFFSTHVVLTVHGSVQTVVVHMDSMPTYKQRIMTRHSKMKLTKQQLQEARMRVHIHGMHCIFTIVILYVHQLT